MVIQPFEFLSKQKLIFGLGKLNMCIELVKDYGQHILLITGKNTFNNNPDIEKVIESMRLSGKIVTVEPVHGEPSPELVNNLVSRYQEKEISLVIAIGGGSVMDTGKAVSAILPSGDKAEHYLEGIGTKKHNGCKTPFIAVPTTAGTGSEATKNAVLSCVSENGYKRSIRHDNLIPDISLIDPGLALNCPSDVTAYSGLDAFTQLLESYVSPKASPIVEALACSGIIAIKDALLKAVSNGKDFEARTAMAYGAYLSGLTLSNAGLGLVHGFASSIGGVTEIPHGIICGSLLGPCIEETIKGLFISGNTRALDKYAGIGFILDGVFKPVLNDLQRKKGCELLLKKINFWINDLNIRNLGHYGLKPQQVDFIVNETDNKSNPEILSKKIIKKILLQSI